MIIIKERQKEREEEVTGQWYTEDAMVKDLKYSKLLGGEGLRAFLAQGFDQQGQELLQ